MARITVEDCIDKIPSRFELVLIASQRARKLYTGDQATVEKENDKNTVIALREIEDETIPLDEMKESLINDYQTVPMLDPEENEGLELEDKLSNDDFAAAVEKDVASVTILTSSRGRLDHSLGNILVACSERWGDLEIELIVDDHLVKVIRSRTKLKGEPSDLLSIFALGGTAFGVTSKGLKWELDGIDLVTGSGLTISNEFVLPEAEISIEQGTIISVQAFSDKAKPKL